ncbi:hypothetical protein IEO21_01202 [Rhodonia placenta]|uniref:Uncharacterized protein n=1 Tax=Rhodonia placenta TaxID=104341 RepID=A0A8H7PAH9_9APHY|nr:hypothetical protein IEO21_01202 [Postia placenta]
MPDNTCACSAERSV